MKKPFLEKLLRILRTRKVLRYLPQNNAIICDIGCGPIPKFLLDLEGKIEEGWGVDKKTTTKSWSDRIRTIKQDLDEDLLLPFIEDKFDCVFLIAVLEHIKFPPLKEIWRVLKPDGIIILTTPTIFSKPILEFLAYRLNLLSKEGIKDIKDHKHYYSKRELIDLLKNLGFYKVWHRYFELGFNQIVFAKKQK